jgi:hypothetical protein
VQVLSTAPERLYIRTKIKRVHRASTDGTVGNRACVISLVGPFDLAGEVVQPGTLARLSSTNPIIWAFLTKSISPSSRIAASSNESPSKTRRRSTHLGNTSMSSRDLSRSAFVVSRLRAQFCEGRAICLTRVDDVRRPDAASSSGMAPSAFAITIRCNDASIQVEEVGPSWK